MGGWKGRVIEASSGHIYMYINGRTSTGITKNYFLQKGKICPQEFMEECVYFCSPLILWSKTGHTHIPFRKPSHQTGVQNTHIHCNQIQTSHSAHTLFETCHQRSTKTSTLRQLQPQTRMPSIPYQCMTRVHMILKHALSSQVNIPESAFDDIILIFRLVQVSVGCDTNTKTHFQNIKVLNCNNRVDITCVDSYILCTATYLT